MFLGTTQTICNLFIITRTIFIGGKFIQIKFYFYSQEKRIQLAQLYHQRFLAKIAPTFLLEFFTVAAT